MQSIFPVSEVVPLVYQSISNIYGEQSCGHLCINALSIPPTQLNRKPCSNPGIERYVNKSCRSTVVLKRCKLIQD
jgi:hypothetical protein